MKKLKRIGLLVDASRAYGRGVCRGVANFAELREDWLILTHERPELREIPDWLEGSRLDALIAYIPNQRLHGKILSLGIPTVDVHGRCRAGEIPVIESEAEAIVTLALEFFARAGFRHFAFCGYPGIFFPISAKRRSPGMWERPRGVLTSMPLGSCIIWDRTSTNLRRGAPTTSGT